MKKREVYFVIGGAVVLLGAWLVQSGPSLARAAGSGEIATQLTAIQRQHDLRTQVEAAAAQLGLTIPRVDASRQEAAVREALARLSSSNGINLGAVKRLQRASRDTAAQTTLDFQIDLTGRYDQLIAFVNALENDSTPFQINELRGRNGQNHGDVTAVMEVRSYLFPRVFLEAPPEEEKPEPEPEAQPQTEDGTTSTTQTEDSGEPATTTDEMTQQPSSGEGEHRRAERPKAENTDREDAASDGTPQIPKRIVLRYQGDEIIVENDTLYVNGQPIPMTDEIRRVIEDGSWRDEIPEDAEVIIE